MLSQIPQIPGGELLDATRSKRLLVGAGTLMLAGGALIIAFRPDFPLVFAALVLEGTTGGFIGAGITAIRLGIVGHSALAERLGRNQRFKSTGSLLAAAIMGAIGYFLSDRMIFIATAVRIADAARPYENSRVRHPFRPVGGRARPSRTHNAAKSCATDIMEKPSAANLRGLLIPVPGGRCLDTAAHWRNAGT